MSYQSSTFKTSENGSNFVQTSSRVVSSRYLLFYSAPQAYVEILDKLSLNPDFSMRPQPTIKSFSLAFLTSLTSEIWRTFFFHSKASGFKMATNSSWPVTKKKNITRDFTYLNQRLTVLWDARSTFLPVTQLVEFLIMISSWTRRKLKS